MTSADDSFLSLNDFEVLPDTPISLRVRGVALEDFDDASPLKNTFCRQMSQIQFEQEAIDETEKALKELITFLDEDPSAYIRLLRKRKKDEVEASGVMSYFKSKFLHKLQGDRYKNKLVTDEEGKQKLEEVKTGMLKAFNYAQESKGVRRSKRLVEKREKLHHVEKDTENKPPQNTPPTNTSSQNMAPPPPPPPPPPPRTPNLDTRIPPPPPGPPPPIVTPFRDVLTPLKNHNSSLRNVTPRPPLKRLSTNSIADLHQELVNGNQLKRLRSIKDSRPHTPIVKKARLSTESLQNNPLNSSEPLTTAFMRIMEQKFRNVRSPSPSVKSPGSMASPGAFSEYSP